MKRAGSLPPLSSPEAALRPQTLQQEPPDCFRRFESAAAILDVDPQGVPHFGADHQVDLMPPACPRSPSRPFVFVYIFLLTRHGDSV